MKYSPDEEQIKFWFYHVKNTQISKKRKLRMKIFSRVLDFWELIQDLKFGHTGKYENRMSEFERILYVLSKNYPLSAIWFGFCERVRRAWRGY